MRTTHVRGIVLLGVLITALAATTGIVAAEQSASTSIQQNADVNADNATIRQDATAQTATNGAEVEQSAEQVITKQPGENISVSRNSSRSVSGEENASITTDLSQNASDTGTGITAQQALNQAIRDNATAHISPTTSADVIDTANMTETEQAAEPSPQQTNALSDRENERSEQLTDTITVYMDRLAQLFAELTAL